MAAVLTKLAITGIKMKNPCGTIIEESGISYTYFRSRRSILSRTISLG